MRLWDWAVQAYARPGVEPLCLALQDQHGQCVSYLLWALWAAGEGRALDRDALAEAAGMARDWETRVVAPLRARRRDPKAATADVREAIKADELAAESRLLERLEARTPPPGGPAFDPHAALRAAAAAWRADRPVSLLDSLADAFSTG